MTDCGFVLVLLVNGIMLPLFNPQRGKRVSWECVYSEQMSMTNKPDSTDMINNTAIA